MHLDKSHADLIETNIAPPMRAAITIPINECGGIVIYVSASQFSPAVKGSLLRDVAKRLMLKEDDNA